MDTFRWITVIVWRRSWGSASRRLLIGAVAALFRRLRAPRLAAAGMGGSHPPRARWPSGGAWSRCRSSPGPLVRLYPAPGRAVSRCSWPRPWSCPFEQPPAGGDADVRFRQATGAGRCCRSPASTSSPSPPTLRSSAQGLLAESNRLKLALTCIPWPGSSDHAGSRASRGPRLSPGRWDGRWRRSSRPGPPEPCSGTLAWAAIATIVARTGPPRRPTGP